METTHRYREIGAFLGVAASLNFTKAAAQLGISQPTLSRLIFRLEEKVGVLLLVRNTRSVHLTMAGKALYNDLQGIDGRIKQSIDIAKKTAKGDYGEIRIAYNSIPINTTLPKTIFNFQKTHKNISLNLYLQTSKVQLKNLAAGAIDIAFGSVANNKDIFSSELISNHAIVAMLNSSDPLAAKTQLSIEDLKDKALILGNQKNWSSFNPLLESFLIRSKLDSNIIHRADDFESICAMISVGYGIGFFIKPTEHMMRRSIVSREVTDLNATIPVILTWRKNLNNPAAKKFIDFVLQQNEQEHNQDL